VQQPRGWERPQGPYREYEKSPKRNKDITEEKKEDWGKRSNNIKRVNEKKIVSAPPKGKIDASSQKPKKKKNKSNSGKKKRGGGLGKRAEHKFWTGSGHLRGKKKKGGEIHQASRGSLLTNLTSRPIRLPPRGRKP